MIDIPPNPSDGRLQMAATNQNRISTLTYCLHIQTILSGIKGLTKTEHAKSSIKEHIFLSFLTWHANYLKVSVALAKHVTKNLLNEQKDLIKTLAG